MSNRTTHAESAEWEIVRYDRSGKWFVEYQGEPPYPGWVGPSYLGMSVNRAGRAPVTVGQAAVAALGLDAQVHIGRPGGSTFDRLLNGLHRHDSSGQ